MLLHCNCIFHVSCCVASVCNFVLQDTVKDEARLKELFDTYDADGSGEISEDELYSIVEELIHNKASAMHIVNVSTN